MDKDPPKLRDPRTPYQLYMAWRRMQNPPKTQVRAVKLETHENRLDPTGHRPIPREDDD